MSSVNYSMSRSFGLSDAFSNILKFGKFYFPAWKHYGRSDLQVVCDKCHTHGIRASIGYGNQDLCLSCADELSSTYPTSTPGCGCMSVQFEPSFGSCNCYRGPGPETDRF